MNDESDSSTAHFLVSRNSDSRQAKNTRPAVTRAIPLLHEEGCPRHKERCREASFEGADGVVENAERFRPARPPRLLLFGGFAASFMSHPPLLREEGNRLLIAQSHLKQTNRVIRFFQIFLMQTPA